MPRYEYKCKKCEKTFEATHGIHDSVEECQYCGGPVRRVFHPVGIVFKGSGFYATDSKKPKYTTKTAGDEGGGESAKPSEPPKKDTAAAKDKPKSDKKADSSSKTTS